MQRSLFKKRWLQLFCGGLVLFFATEQALRLTGDPNYFPTVILLGAFLVPATFVVFFYGQESGLDKGLHHDSALPSAAICFFVGGIIGIVAAGLVEYKTLNAMSFGVFLGVGFIEESTKLILPIIYFIRGRFRSEIDGLLFGVASGMGFAALETMGYGLVSMIQSQGDISTLEQVLLSRGIISPASHAAWTGIITAAMWHQREKTGKYFTWPVLGFFVVSVLLHAVWDLVSGSNNFAIILSGYLVIAGISLALLIRRIVEARKNSHPGKTQTSSTT